MKKRWIISLMCLVCCFLLFFGCSDVEAGDFELSPYKVVAKSGDSPLELEDGHGLMMVYNPFINKYGKLGLFVSYDMRGVELNGSSIGNLNTLMIGPNYRTPKFWKYFDISVGGGYAKAHDSDMENSNQSSFTVKHDKTYYDRVKKCWFYIYYPVNVYSDHVRTVTDEVEYDDGYGAYATLNFTMPVKKRHTLGFKVGARYVDFDSEVTRTTSDYAGTTIEEIDSEPEKIAYLAAIEWTIKF